jgi:hypothetical protein
MKCFSTNFKDLIYNTKNNEFEQKELNSNFLQIKGGTKWTDQQDLFGPRVVPVDMRLG